MADITIRKAGQADMDRILEIYSRARTYMAETGNPNQWINGYPSRDDVQKDLDKKALYVCEEQDEIEAVFMFATGEEPNYAVIEQGEWLNGAPYGYMHRVASAGRKKGMASVCMQWCFEQCGNLRGDTHKDNKIMQSVFEKNGFERCGVVYMEDGTPRIAYHKIR